jgi:vitamin K-dependent gamma-carboxylase
MLTKARTKLLEPRDAASLAVFRFLFGTILCLSSVRFLWNGWVERFYVRPTFFFKYWGFEWVEVLPEPWMTAAYVAMAVLGGFVAVGFLYRVSIVALFVIFTYVELIDVTNYLNHYYLVSLLAFLMCFLPLHRAYSVDAWIWPSRFQPTVPAWMLYLMRFQIAVVYFYAGIAKLQPDWLLHAQPLGIWLAARTETPLIGGLLALPAMPHIMSWAGFLNDTLVVPFLLWKRTRPYAFATVFFFHLCTHLLFVIGVFPFLMVSGATLFFDADWPRKLARRVRGLAPVRASSPEPSTRTEQTPPAGQWSAAAALLVALYCVVQAGMPLRAFLYPGDVLWHEQGMRYSWRVMVREKNGSIRYRVRWDGSGREVQVSPSQYLTSHQEREMSGQPDLILQLARHIAADFEARGHRNVEVRADALVSLNGRRAAPMIDADANLADERDTVAVMRWIAPAPPGDPLPAYPDHGNSRSLIATTGQAAE